MTIAELKAILDKAIERGYGDAEVRYLNTGGSTFVYTTGTGPHPWWLASSAVLVDSTPDLLSDGGARHELHIS